MLSQNFVYVPHLSNGATCPSYFMLFIWWSQQNLVTTRYKIRKSRAKKKFNLRANNQQLNIHI